MQRTRFEEYRHRLLAIAEIIPLSRDILAAAILGENRNELEPQDAIVYASIQTHLEGRTVQPCCFLNRNTKDFDNSNIGDELKQYQCRMIPRFDHGREFIVSNLSK